MLSKSEIENLYKEAGCDNPELNTWKQGYCHALKEVLEEEYDE